MPDPNDPPLFENEPDWDDDRPRSGPRRRRDDEDDFDRPRRRPRPETNGWAVAGLVLGIMSLLGGLCVTGIPAIICSVIGRTKPTGRGMATAGLVTGTLGTFLTIAAGALLVWSVGKVRDAAARARDTNNLKQIALGTHTYHDVEGMFPRADGNLSWRVQLLPHVNEKTLYARFDQKQPWDGPANRPLADVRVEPYVSATDPDGFTQTRYRVFTGPGTIFDPKQGRVTMANVTDGTSYTILVVEAAEAVPWPQPKELPYAKDAPLPALGLPNRNVFLMAKADGSVVMVNKNIDEGVLRAAITRGGGETMPKEWWLTK